MMSVPPTESIPKECMNSTEELTIEIRVRIIEQDREHRLRPVSWTYMRKENDWSYEPRRQRGFLTEDSRRILYKGIFNKNPDIKFLPFQKLIQESHARYRRLLNNL